MTARQPRFEIVRTDADQPWHARFRAANGRIVWVTENYRRRDSAAAAIDSINWLAVLYVPVNRMFEVRILDEREVTP